MSVTVVTAPEKLPFSMWGIHIFLGGGITGCPNWQADAIELFRAELGTVDKAIFLYNPRRPNFDVNDPDAADEQIRWEFRALNRSIVMMWFCKETVQPICFYELGRHLALRPKNVYIGAHPDYPRRRDVVLQSDLAGCPGLVVSSLPALVKCVVGGIP